MGNIPDREINESYFIQVHIDEFLNKIKYSSTNNLIISKTTNNVKNISNSIVSNECNIADNTFSHPCIQMI